MVKDPDTIISWDGKKRSYEFWNQDLMFRKAYAVSAVWVYQSLTKKLGKDLMLNKLRTVGYGNNKIGDNFTNFWLDGSLKISAQEQVFFLQRLAYNQLPFSQKTLESVKHIMIEERTKDYTLRTKTGLAGPGSGRTPPVGWYVGYLEYTATGNKIYFAFNMDIRSEKDIGLRKKIVKQSLKELGFLK